MDLPLDSALLSMLSYTSQALPPYIGRACAHDAAVATWTGVALIMNTFGVPQQRFVTDIQHGEAREMSMWNIIFFIDRPVGGNAAQGRGAPIFG